MSDIRFAIRSLVKHRGFTCVAVLTLALGIGANTAIFSVVYGVLLRPLPYPDADRIVQVWPATTATARDGHSAGDFLDLQRGAQSLTAMAGYREDAVTIAAPSSDPVRVSGAIVTAEYFEVFGLPAALGRPFSRAQDAGSGEAMVVLGDEVWREQFAADPHIVGKRARLNGTPHTVIGVMPARFRYPENVRVWVLSSRPVPPPPLDVQGDLLDSRDVRYFQAVARLAPGMTVRQATADLQRITDDLGRRFPASSGGRTIRLQPLREGMVGDVRGPLLVLLGAVGLVLLIACANVSSLLLARASGRQRELAIRAALGARRSRIVRQLIVESLLLAGAGGAAGLLSGWWGVGLLVSVLPDGTPRADGIGLDVTVAAATIGLSGASALLFGLVPALQASRTDPSAALRTGERGSTGDRRRARTRSALVVAEVALTMILLVSAGLLANSFLRLQRVDPGFQTEGVLVVDLPLPQSRYTDGKRQAAFYERVLGGVRQQAGVRSAAILFPSPLDGNSAQGAFAIEGRPTATARTDRPRASIAAVSDDYFRTLGIPVIRGRDFTEHDHDPAPAAVIVNATLARRYWPGEDAIGKRLRFGEGDDDWLTVVGIVGDTRNIGLDNEPAPLLYISYQQFTLPFMGIAIRSDAPASAIASIVRDQLRLADPDLPVDRIQPLHEILDEAVAQPRFRTWVISAFAVMGAVLAAVGVYGLISYSVSQRTREIGIRIALGASAAHVMRSVVREGLLLGAIGVAIGTAGAMAATRVLSSFLFGVEATDPVTFAAVAILLLAIAALASYVPSRRALRVDPLTALRAE
jgi:predicted permease